MLNDVILDKLLQADEGDMLDFKKEFYDFGGDKNERKRKDSKFIKDIVSFANTIREESSYIICGVQDLPREIVGVDKNSLVDDSILQEKIKDKLKPIPKFHTYRRQREGLELFIIEIPVVKYPTPCTALSNIGGMTADRVYFRRGSSNAEANTEESYRISAWLERLKSIEEYEEGILPKLSKREKRNFGFVSLIWLSILLMTLVDYGLTGFSFPIGLRLFVTTFAWFQTGTVIEDFYYQHITRNEARILMREEQQNDSDRRKLHNAFIFSLSFLLSSIYFMVVWSLILSVISTVLTAILDNVETS